jgi:ribulokinase
MGLDMGTTGVRAGIFNLLGVPIAFCEKTYPTYIPRSGWAEQNPDEWWDAVCETSNKAIKQSGISSKQIVGLSIDTTCCTVLAVGKDLKPLRPAILWMDVRAADQAGRISNAASDALEYNGFGNVSAECMPCKALWIKENEPDLYKDAKYIYECNDWLMYQLTGIVAASLNNVSTRWYYNQEKGGWPVDFYEEIGLGDLLQKFPAEIFPLGQKVGTLSKEAASKTGLNAGIPVGQGGADAFVGMIALKAIRPERMALITGSSHLHLVQTNGSIHKKGLLGSYPNAVIDGLQLLEGGQISTGSIVNWFKKNYCGNLSYDILNGEAEKLPVGAEGLLVLDYFQGNRTPHVDPCVRGLLYGLSLNHSPAHIYRAIIEGICYGTRQIIDLFLQAGVNIQEISISGGAVKSSFWLQVHADVCNMPITVPKVSEAPCLGSAILGAVAAGAYPDIVTAVDNMAYDDKVIQPNESRHKEYDFYYEKYIQAYDLMHAWMQDITKHASQL